MPLSDSLDAHWKRNFRRRLLAGEALYGTMVTLDSPAVVELLCHVGFDWLFLETEHAPLLPDAVQRLGRRQECESNRSQCAKFRAQAQCAANQDQ